MSSLMLPEFVALPSNLQALESIQDFISRRTSFLILYGPSGWGKSHLLREVAAELENSLGQKCNLSEAKTYLSQPKKPNLTKWLILDHVHEVTRKTTDKQALRTEIEKRIRLSKPTLLAMTYTQSETRLRSTFDCREWEFVKLPVAQPEEKSVLIRIMANRLEIELSEQIINLISGLSYFNGSSILGAIHRLKITKSNWLSHEDTLLALGVLQPQLMESQFGDFRDRINQILAGPDVEIKPQVTKKELMYVLNQVCGLSEHATASYFYTEPGEVYKCIKTVSQKRIQSPERMNYLINHLVNKLI